MKNNVKQKYCNNNRICDKFIINISHQQFAYNGTYNNKNIIVVSAYISNSILY